MRLKIAVLPGAIADNVATGGNRDTVLVIEGDKSAAVKGVEILDGQGNMVARLTYHHGEHPQVYVECDRIKVME